MDKSDRLHERIALTINDLLHRDDGVEHIVMAVDAAGITHTHSWREQGRSKARQFKKLLKESDVVYTEIKIVRREWKNDMIYHNPTEVR